MVRPGYAIEYDYVDPRELRRSWRRSACRAFISRARSMGQPGYEEAAAQGLWPVINAARAVVRRRADRL